MIRTVINKWDWQMTDDLISYRLPVTLGKLDENVPVLHRHSWEPLSRSSQSVRSPPPAGCCYSSCRCWHCHQSYHTDRTPGPAQWNRVRKNQGRKISKWLKRCVNKGAWTDPVGGWDVNQQTSPLVPADGDVLSQQQSVKLARAYNLHLRALQHRLLHFHLHERQKDDDERGSKTSEFFCWIIKK